MSFEQLLNLCPQWDKIKTKVSLYTLDELVATSKQAVQDKEFLDTTQLNQYFLLDVASAIDSYRPNRHLLLSLFVINYHYYCVEKLKL